MRPTRLFKKLVLTKYPKAFCEQRKKSAYRFNGDSDTDTDGNMWCVYAASDKMATVLGVGGSAQQAWREAWIGRNNALQSKWMV